ncbi:MAG TPA: (d)CMP kinase [Stellaceae bacterium]|nr:(d)CMP kinase [Stellaceae bacterium]
MIIAVDGPAASGKGTLARRLAQHYRLAHLDTGGLYRATALRALLAGGDPADPAVAVAAARAVRLSDVDDARLRDERVGEAASVVAAIPAVRETLLGFQREFAHHPPGDFTGAVLDGRDIGTAVCPEADAKIFVTATLEARALRRFKELQADDSGIIYERVLQDMKARDARDSGRATAPLRRAPDALELDTTGLDADAAFAAAVAFIAGKLAGRSR